MQYSLGTIIVPNSCSLALQAGKGRFFLGGASDIYIYRLIIWNTYVHTHMTHMFGLQNCFQNPYSFFWVFGCHWVLHPTWFWWLSCQSICDPQKNGKTGELGQDRLEVRWGAVMFLFNVVNLNVWLFLSVNLAKCVVEVVVIMFGLNEGDNCWGGQSFYV